MSTLSILSIDLDYAYSPVISSYDDFVEGSRISLQEQKEIFTTKHLPAPKINPAKIQYLQSIWQQVNAMGRPQIAEGIHHHEIIQHLHGSKFRIVNVDHHHDILYPGWHEPSVLDEGNWVHWLAQQQKIEQYTWIRNTDSEDLDATVSINFPFIETEFILPTELPLFDFIFLCSSPHWTGVTSNSILQYLETGTHDHL